MSSFISIFIWLILIAFVSRFTEAEHIEDVHGNECLRYDYKWVILMLIPLVLMTAFRSDSFGDTWAYRSNFRMLPSSIFDMSSYLSTNTKDKGFSVLSIFIKSIIGDRDKLYFGILALIQGGIVFFVFRKYSEDFWLSVFLFLASADYVAWMFNGIRQFTAAVIIFAATSFIIDKKYILAIVAVVLASALHQSALIMLPIIFIVQGRPWNFRTIVAFGLMIGATVFVDRFTDFLRIALEDTQYFRVIDDYMSFGDDGTNPLRVAVYSVPAAAALLLRNRVSFENDRVINICVNMSVMTAGIYLVSMVTSGIYFGRLPIYTSMYSYILLPWLIEKLFEKRSATILKLLLIVAYMGFYYYQMHITWGLF